MSPLMEQILREIEQLAPDEQRQLSQRLASRLQETERSHQPKRKLSEFRGIAPSLLEGQDAQEWVNELRDEWEVRQGLRDSL